MQTIPSGRASFPLLNDADSLCERAPFAERRPQEVLFTEVDVAFLIVALELATGVKPVKQKKIYYKQKPYRALFYCIPVLWALFYSEMFATKAWLPASSLPYPMLKRFIGGQVNTC